MQDVYAILGVSRTATDEELHKAYKRKAREMHPDHGGNLDAMAMLNEAYSMVKTPELRKKYDSSHSFSTTMATWSAAMGKSTVARDFGKKPVHSDPRMKSGTDIQVSVEVSMEAFINGASVMTVEYEVENECLECSGTGGTSLEICQACGGKGKTREISPMLVDSVVMCTKCHGVGRVPVGKCSVCGGTGRSKKKTKHTFRYKRGTLAMIVVGKGNGGLYGGPNGRLLLAFHPKETDKLSFDGEKFIYEDTIPVEDFILGTHVEMVYPGPMCMIPVNGGNKYDFTYICENLANTGYQCLIKLRPAVEPDPEKVAEPLKQMREMRKDIILEQENK